MKIALLLASTLSPFTQSQLKPILNDKEFEIVLAIIDNRQEKNIWQRIQKNWRRGRGGYIFVMAIQTLFDKSKENIPSSDFFRNLQIPIRKVSKAYSKLNIDHIKKYEPDILFLFSGFGIVREPLLSLAPLGMISQHHGDMRKYRGMPPAFWELYNGEKEMGVTVQRLNDKLDLGIPILEKSVPINATDSWKNLRERAFKASEKMPYLALKLIHDQKALNKPLESGGKVYTLPNLRQWLRLQWLIIRRRLTN